MKLEQIKYSAIQNRINSLVKITVSVNEDVSLYREVCHVYLAISPVKILKEDMAREVYL